MYKVQEKGDIQRYDKKGGIVLKINKRWCIMKSLIVLMIVLMIGGCGVPAGETGSSGSASLETHEPTPVLRNYTDVISVEGIMGAEFTDVTTNIDILLYSVGWGDADLDHNYLYFDVEDGQSGKAITLEINGTLFTHAIGDNTAHVLYFEMGESNIYHSPTNIEVGVTKYLDINDPTSYFKWYYYDGVTENLREHYYCDEFKR